MEFPLKIVMSSFLFIVVQLTIMGAVGASSYRDGLLEGMKIGTDCAVESLALDYTVAQTANCNYMAMKALKKR